MASTPTALRSTDWASLFLLGLLWGGSFFFARIAVMHVPPLALVLYRVSLAALVLHFWLRVQKVSFAPAWPLSGQFFCLALLNNVIPFSLIFIGQTAIGAGLASVLYATTPLWTILVANALTTDEKVSLGKVAGIGLGVAGVAVMLGPGFLAGIGTAVVMKLAVLGAALSYAFAAVYAKRFKRLSPTLVATGQLTASSVVMLPVVLFLYRPSDIVIPGIEVAAAVCALAVLCTAFAFILYFRLIASIGATNASLVTLLVPASAIALGAIFLGERLDLLEIVGMVLILASLLVVTRRS